MYLCFALGLILLDGATANGELVAHWKADGGHDGTLVNGTQYGPGVAGQAFLFDGIDDFVTVDAHPELEPLTFSIAVWVNVKPEKFQLTADSSHFAPGTGWALQINNNLARFAYGNGSGFPEVISNSVVSDNTFHHIAATLDGTFLRIYVDGTLDSTKVFSGTATPSGRDILFGRRHIGGRELDGLIDDIRIYNHVLSSMEIEAGNHRIRYGNNFNIFRGFYVFGELSDTFNSDDSYLKFNPGITIIPPNRLCGLNLTERCHQTAQHH